MVLGVRCGIYIQAISFFLAAFHLKKESAYLQSSAFVFLLAIFIALMRETVKRTLRALESRTHGLDDRLPDDESGHRFRLGSLGRWPASHRFGCVHLSGLYWV
jgi:hypothetical protein